jgi:polysaccharide biosynthesis protein PslL
MNSIQSDRLAFIDITKGLGIVSVVAGHIYPPGMLHSLIYLFHIPLFFFISGYLFKIKEDKAFASAKLIQLIVPYLSFLILVYTMQNRHFFNSAEFSYAQLALLYFKAFLGGRWLYGYTAAFWFVPVLFVVLVTANWLLKRVKMQTLMLIVLASLTGCYLNSMVFSSLKVPFNINVVLAALPIFLAGYYCKQYPLKRFTVIGCLFLAMAVILSYFNRLPTLDMKKAVYGFPVLSFTAAIAISLLLFTVSKLIAENLPVPANVLRALGQSSLVIMFLHQSVQILLREYFTANCPILMVFSLLIPYLFYLVFRANPLCRAMFLGSKEDAVKLLAKWPGLFNGIPFKRKATVSTELVN